MVKGSQFLMVDGEGVTTDHGHDYVLLSVGTQSLHRNGERLTFSDIMPFLYRQQQLNPDAIFGGFYLSYDWSHWLRDIPADKAWFLLNDKGIALRRAKHPNRREPFPVRHAGWEFDIMGMRRFRLRPHTSKPYEIDNVHRWLYICDMGPFWQTSLLNAISPEKWPEPLTSEDEWNTILEGKRQRSTAVFDLNMIRYNVTENIVFARAMDKLATGLRQQGWRLRKDQWFGPGQVAEQWLRSIGAPTADEIHKLVPEGVLDAGRGAYYGGWFEIPRHGHIPDVSYEYDINSAYPYVIAGMPCLRHGTWHNRSTYTNDVYQLAKVSVYGSDPFIGPLPHRDSDGIISRPHFTSGWYWRHELEASIAAGLVDDYTIHETWTYEPCDCKPFVDIKRLYQQRQQVGKETATGKALKLVYNSAYGKFAQSVGNPKYSNAVYASFITAGCRTLILSSIASHRDKSRAVVMVATDGVYFRTRNATLDSQIGSALGGFSRAEKRNLTLFMPGVYWDDKTRSTLDSDNVAIRSRGISASDLAARVREIDDRFAEPFTSWPSIKVPIRFSIVTPKLALHRNRWDLCGSVTVHPPGPCGVDCPGDHKVLSSDPRNKREGDPFIDDGVWTTRPYADKGASQPYSKTFAQDVQAMLDNDVVFTDNGDVNLELVEMMKQW